jgi:hypothetical protein
VSILLDDYVVSFIVLDLCLVDGVVVLKVNFEYIEMEENTMCFDEAQDVTACLKSKKTLLSLFFSIV